LIINRRLVPQHRQRAIDERHLRRHVPPLVVLDEGQGVQGVSDRQPVTGLVPLSLGLYGGRPSLVETPDADERKGAQGVQPGGPDRRKPRPLQRVLSDLNGLLVPPHAHQRVPKGPGHPSGHHEVTAEGQHRTGQLLDLPVVAKLRQRDRQVGIQPFPARIVVNRAADPGQQVDCHPRCPVGQRRGFPGHPIDHPLVGRHRSGEQLLGHPLHRRPRAGQRSSRLPMQRRPQTRRHRLVQRLPDQSVPEHQPLP
jgi:hypothetical protein